MTARTTRRQTPPAKRTGLSPRLRTRSAVAGALAVTGALLLAGCGDQTDSADKGPAKDVDTKAPLYAKLPKEIQDKGAINAGTDAAFKPMEYKAGERIAGFDPDLGAALGKELGVPVRFSNGTFDGLITSMQSKRYDIVMSSVSDTEDRRKGLDESGKKVGEGIDFVDYFDAGFSVLVQRSNPQHVKSVDDLCGKKVAVQQGTVSHDIVKAQSAKCAKSGKGKIALEPFESDDEVRVRLKGGGVAASVADYPVAAYAAKSGKDFTVVGDQMQSGPYGIAVDKDNKQLRDALKAAMDKVIANGEYAKLLEKWGLEAGAVKKAQINGGS
ncbi:ABC transporter substrate-binding protein [Streptomyces sp. ODS28]|uniref:ABC transporter substrate-binding protein n=1 Tax=Streptomyces sp. ODS28 TaxID=3136688 RepID=UPI0031EA0EB1